MPGASGRSATRAASPPPPPSGSPIAGRSPLPAVDLQLAQLAQLVAERRRLLELEPLGGRLHLLLEACDALGERDLLALGDLQELGPDLLRIVEVAERDERTVDVLED